MLHTPMAARGMVTAPHHLAAQSGLAVLRDGGNAVEAAIAAAATVSVVYPHMCGLGGDAFWLIHEPGRLPVSIDGSGAAAGAADPAAYAERGVAGAMPRHGVLAACTVAGAVSSWQAALELSRRWGGSLPLSRLFADAIHYARSGFAVTAPQSEAATRLLEALKGQPGFAETFLKDGEPPPAGSRITLPRLADSLERLAKFGLDDFYRGGLGYHIGAELQRLGSPLAAEDMARHRSVRRRPLQLEMACGTVYNTPPPTQGLASLMILGMFERLGVDRAEGFAHVHGLVEATKQAFLVRNAHVTDPAHMTIHATTYLTEGLLDRLAANLSRERAAPWPQPGPPGDTVWIGVADDAGRMVSLIQSLSTAFGAGVLLKDTGILWHNRGASFQLEEGRQNLLAPRRKPYHTLSPALAVLKDGRVLSYGTMGGEGQPQTQAAVFSRHVMFGQPLQQAVSAPRWALGRGWSGPDGDLKLESRFDPALIDALRGAGHAVTVVEPFDTLMGHAGAVLRHADGLLEGAADPRGNGVVAAF